jgi:hypothetical protein
MSPSKSQHGAHWASPRVPAPLTDWRRSRDAAVGPPKPAAVRRARRRSAAVSTGGASLRGVGTGADARGPAGGVARGDHRVRLPRARLVAGRNAPDSPCCQLRHATSIARSRWIQSMPAAVSSASPWPWRAHGARARARPRSLWALLSTPSSGILYLHVQRRIGRPASRHPASEKKPGARSTAHRFSDLIKGFIHIYNSKVDAACHIYLADLRSPIGWRLLLLCLRRGLEGWLAARSRPLRSAMAPTTARRRAAHRRRRPPPSSAVAAPGRRPSSTGAAGGRNVGQPACVLSARNADAGRGSSAHPGPTPRCSRLRETRRRAPSSS